MFTDGEHTFSVGERMFLNGERTFRDGKHKMYRGEIVFLTPWDGVSIVGRALIHLRMFDAVQAFCVLNTNYFAALPGCFQSRNMEKKQ